MENDEGINCRLYGSLVVRSLGFLVPDYYESGEWFYDPENCLEEILCPKEIQTGDVLGFCKKGEANMHNIHIGIARVDGEVIKVFHASRSAGKVICTSLMEMSEDARHENFVMIRRPKVAVQELYNQENLAFLGFYS